MNRREQLRNHNQQRNILCKQQITHKTTKIKLTNQKNSNKIVANIEKKEVTHT